MAIAWRKLENRTQIIRPALLVLFSLASLSLSNCGGSSAASIPTPPPGPAASVNISITPATVNAGQPATLTWSAANVTTCTASDAWQDTPLTSGTSTLASVSPNTYTYSLSCTGSYGTATNSATLTVTSAPSQVAIPLPGMAAACTSNCYYVDANSGSDSNSGLSLATAFKSLQQAANVVGPGATVTVMSGTYMEPNGGWLILSTSGTANAWIRFIAGPGQHPVIQVSPMNTAWYGVQIKASYIDFEGFEIIGQNQSLTAAQVGAGNSSLGLFNENCLGIDGTAAGPVPHDIILRNNVVHDCSEAGIGVDVADSLTIAYNTVYNNSWWTSWDSSGISLYHMVDVAGATVTGGYKNFIVGNVAFNNSNNIPFIGITPPIVTDGNGIIYDDNRHTQHTGNPNDPQNVPYNGRTYIANNVVYANGGRGIHAYSSAHVDIVNNTTYNDMFSPSIPWAEIDAYSCYDVNIVNNVAVNLNGKQVDESDGNAYWYNLWNGSNVPQVGTNGLVADPQFTDAAKANFIPKAGSPALASGTAALAPLVDFNGSARPASTIDRGAYQVTH